MTDRSVRFKDDRTPVRSRDSGLGSSTEQAHVGGRSDRLFTAQDVESQRYNLSALNEALNTANENCRRFKQKSLDREAEVSQLKRAKRDDDAQIRDLIAENQTLQAEVERCHKVIDSLHQENLKLHQPYPDISSHDRHDSDNMTDRMRVRINKNTREADGSSAKSSLPSSSSQKEAEKERTRHSSIKPSRKPYIEDNHKSRGAPPAKTRGLENYTVATGVSPLALSGVEAMPRSAGSYGAYQSIGDYYPEPLPHKTDTKNSPNRKHRH